MQETNLPVVVTQKAPRVRHDGWTAARQAAFCEALAKSGR